MKKIINWIKANPIITFLSSIALIGLLYTIFGGKKDKSNLAKCLKDNGAKFYGAYWCPHCKHQKSLFDNPDLLPYIECAGANNQSAKACKDAGITGYPTWIFADGKKISGELTIEQLKKYSNC